MNAKRKTKEKAARAAAAARVGGAEERHFSVGLGALFVLALSLRVVFLLQLQETPFFSGHISDSRIYLNIAEAIRTGTAPERAWFMSPLYPLILALAQSLGNVDVLARAMQCLMGAAVAVFTTLLGREMFGARSGFIAGLLVAVSPELMFYDNTILTESLLAFCLIAHVWLLSVAERRVSTLFAVFSGLALGAALVTRFSLALYPAMLLAFHFRRPGAERPGARQLVALFAAAVLVIAPFTLRNAFVEGVFVPVTSAGGFNLHAGNNATSQGWYSVPEGVDIARDPNGHSFAERELSRVLNSREVSSFWSAKARAWIFAHPGDFISLLLRKAVLFFHPRDLDQIGLSPGFIEREYSTTLSLPFMVPFAILLPPALAGLFFMLADKRRRHPLVVLSAAIFLSTILFFVSSRFRVPLIPVMAVFAGYAIHRIVETLRRRAFGKQLLPAVFAFAAVIPLYLAQPEIPDGYEREYQTLGDIAFQRGDYGGAERFFARSLAERPTADAHMNRGNALAALGRPAEALPCYDSALALRPSHALALFNRGNALMQLGRPGAAFDAWRRCASLDPDFGPVHRNMGVLLLRARRFAEAVPALERAAQLERDPAQRAAIEQDCALARAMLRDAER